jgi:hypothetical protein
MVFEHQHEYPSQWKTVCSVADMLDLSRETLRNWSSRPTSMTAAGRA